ncbi:MAG TPA: hypothetical protein VD887_13315 [Allosphingosinicella sp.]|nr:hypothetical protein [Allosphingosinicella sp.]HYG31179.1 hypothetical protein [Allosphingosinicella sp.]
MGPRIVAAAFLLALAGPVLAQPAAAPAPSRGVDDPRAFVERVYRNDSEAPADGEAAGVYSDRLRALFDDESRDAGGEIGRLDFDFWVNGQDSEIAAIEVTEEEVFGRPDRRVVVARFTNFGEPQTNLFYFERIRGRWYLDDVRNLGRPGEPGGGWTLSLLLRYGR